MSDSEGDSEEGSARTGHGQLQWMDTSVSDVSAETEASGIAESGLKKMLRRLDVDRAVGFAVLSRFWQLLTGPVTQLLIALSFTRATQDFYYAFGNMLSMQIFVELGLNVVLINLVSHEWASLSLENGRLSGCETARSRLISLGRLMFRWYGIAAILFAVLVSLAGMGFFSDTTRHRQAAQISTEAVEWFWPWSFLVVSNALQLWLLPRTAILEGCGQLGVVNRWRFFQAVTGSFAVWALMIGGMGLWAIVASSVIRLTGETLLVFWRYRFFFLPFRERNTSARVHWKKEILPLQWRMAVQGSVMWFSSQMPGLILLRQAEGETGRFGMTMAILTALQSASMAWIETRRPQFGALIARREFSELDRLFFRLTRTSMLLLTAAVASFALGVAWLGTRDEWLPTRLVERVMPLLPTVIFSLGMIAYQFVMCSGIYVRAHRRDPYLLTTVASCTTIAVLQWILGQQYGTTGLAVGYAVGVLLLQFPLGTAIWWQSRRKWHD